jgi:hypothetical protein
MVRFDEETSKQSVFLPFDAPAAVIVIDLVKIRIVVILKRLQLSTVMPVRTVVEETSTEIARSGEFRTFRFCAFV